MLGVRVECYRFLFAWCSVCFEVKQMQFRQTYTPGLSSSDWQLLRIAMIHSDSLLLMCSAVKAGPQDSIQTITEIFKITLWGRIVIENVWYFHEYYPIYSTLALKNKKPQ